MATGESEEQSLKCVWPDRTAVLSVSTACRRKSLKSERSYYEVLEKTQAGSLDITKWLTWFLGCLDRAIEQSNQITSSALEKELFWKSLKQRKVSLNDRQTKVLNKLFSGFEGKLTRDKWMKMTKASSRTALRDIEELIAIGVIEQEEAGGRSTSYRLKKGQSDKVLEN